jgi:hypothetical protein
LLRSCDGDPDAEGPDDDAADDGGAHDLLLPSRKIDVDFDVDAHDVLSGAEVDDDDLVLHGVPQISRSKEWERCSSMESRGAVRLPTHVRPKRPNRRRGLGHDLHRQFRHGLPLKRRTAYDQFE